MKTGMSITDLAKELERQKDVRRDFTAPTGALILADDARTLRIGDASSGQLTQHAKRQLGEKLQVPVALYDRLEAKHPDLLAHLVNQLFQREPNKLMVRTLDQSVRGIMSSRFRPLDNYDLAEAAFPVLVKAGAEIVSCNLTETKLYIKALLPWLDRELPMPEGLKMGVGHNFFVRKITGAITITNSDVGASRLLVSPGIFERQCTNLAVFKDDSFGKLHIGKDSGSDEGISEYLSDQTRAIEDAAFWAKVRDVVQATMDGRVMDAIVARLQASRGDVISGNPEKVVEVFAKKQGLNETEKGGLLRHLVGSGEMTRYGLQWAVTRLAQDVESYDRASDLERLGGAVIELPRSDWQALAEAA